MLQLLTEMNHNLWQVLWPPNHAKTIGALNVGPDESLFLPPSFLVETVLPAVLAVVAFATVVYALNSTCVVPYLIRSTNIMDDVTSRQQRRKIAYQATNLVINAGLGLAGLYYEKTMTGDVDVAHKVRGHTELVYFSTVQIGYQLWAIPMGLCVGEPATMFLHHAAVICVSSMSAFLVTGFRYWTPFFYGLVELSSVPLAVMNFFRDHPVLQRQHPEAYARVRLAFATSFLYIRVYLFAPRQYLFLRDHALLVWAAPSSLYGFRAFMAIVWASSFFLLMLQLYWGSLIVRGILKCRGGSQTNGNGGGMQCVVVTPEKHRT